MRADIMPVMVPVMLDDLPPALKRRAEGTTEVALVRDVISRVHTEDDGTRTIVLTWVLADPPSGMDTWPIEELWELRRVAREVVPQAVARAVAEAAREAGTTAEVLPAFSWTVEFQPEHMPPLAKGDESFDL
jgi:hypothetical protein